MGQYAAVGWRVHQGRDLPQEQEVLPSREAQSSHLTTSHSNHHTSLSQGMIEALFLDEGELISAGVDGYIRVSPYHSK